MEISFRLKGLLLGILLVSSLLNVLNPKLWMVGAPSGEAFLGFEPPYIEVFTNTDFNVDVVAWNVVNLARFNLTIGYHPFFLGVLSIEVKPPFECVYQNVTPHVGIVIHGILSAGQPPQNGTVPLATISFRALATGFYHCTELFFRGPPPTVLIDSEGMLIPIYWPPPTCTIIIHPRTIIVPDDYPTIQEAADASCPGDIIYVRAGIYQGSVNVTKAFLNIVGESRETTTVQGGFFINADYVSLKNFKIVGGSGNIAIDVHGNNVTVQHNIIEYSREGVVIWNECDVSYNLIQNCELDGVRLTGLWSNGRVSHNNITNCTYGIVADSGCGLICDNLIHCSEIGIALLWASFEIRENTICNCGWSEPDFGSAIVIFLSSNIKITENLIKNNRRGLYLFRSSNIEVLSNSFINNSLQVDLSETSGIIWDCGYPKGGNYWSDYNGSDHYWGVYQNMTGADGIGDVPYVINQDNIDRYPLMKPHNQYSHDVAVIDATVNATVVEAGDTVKIEVLIKNLGDRLENTQLQIYANDIQLAVQDILLPINETEIVVYEWRVNMPKGNYTIWAQLSTVEGETNINNNIKVAGNVNVIKWHNIAVSVVMPKTQYTWGETAKMGIIIENEGDYLETISIKVEKPYSYTPICYSYARQDVIDYFEIPPGVSKYRSGVLCFESLGLWWTCWITFNITINNPSSISRTARFVLLVTPKDPPVGDPIVTMDPDTGWISSISVPSYKTVVLNPCSQTLIEVEYPPLKTFSIWLYLVPIDNISTTTPISVSIDAIYSYYGSFQAIYGPSYIGQRFILLESGSVSAVNFEWTPDGYLPFSGPLGYTVYCPPVDNEFITYDNVAWGVFYVVEPPQLLISNVTTTDQNGNPKNCFGRGEVVQFDISITNLGNSEVESFLTAVMVLDPTGTPQFICYTLDGIKASGTRRFVFGFRIPSECPAGTYTAKVMIFTDWPSNGGIGLDVQTVTFNVS